MATKAKAVASTAVTKAKIQLPANIADRLKADVAALQGKLAASTGKSISVTQSKQFRFPDGTTVDSFKGVVLGFVSYNAYYEGEFDRDNVVPPNCFALGVVKNDELTASTNSPDLQNADEGNACKSCWANQWKSAAKGNGKACKNNLKLAILCADGETRPLTLSSTALKPFGGYVREVVQGFGIAPYGVLTEFCFSADDYSSVRCKNVVLLNEEQLAEAYSRVEDAMEMLSVEPDCNEFEEKVVAAREKPKGKTAKPLPAAKGKPARA